MQEQQQLDLDNKEWQDALQIINYTRRSLFLTGKAGTGKSTFLRYISKNTKKKHVILAPTGIAAINAGGSTLHSFFKLPFHPLSHESFLVLPVSTPSAKSLTVTEEGLMLS